MDGKIDKVTTAQGSVRPESMEEGGKFEWLDDIFNTIEIHIETIIEGGSYPDDVREYINYLFVNKYGVTIQERMKKNGDQGMLDAAHANNVIASKDALKMVLDTQSRREKVPEDSNIDKSIEQLPKITSFKQVEYIIKKILFDISDIGKSIDFKNRDAKIHKSDFEMMKLKINLLKGYAPILKSIGIYLNGEFKKYEKFDMSQEIFKVLGDFVDKVVEIENAFNSKMLVSGYFDKNGVLMELTEEQLNGVHEYYESLKGLGETMSVILKLIESFKLADLTKTIKEISDDIAEKVKRIKERGQDRALKTTPIASNPKTTQITLFGKPRKRFGKSF